MNKCDQCENEKDNVKTYYDDFNFQETNICDDCNEENYDLYIESFYG